MGPDTIPTISKVHLCRALESQPHLVDVSSVMQRLPATSVTTSCWCCNAEFSDFTVAREHLIRNHFCNGCCCFHQNHDDVIHHSEVFDFFESPYPCSCCHLQFETVSELQIHSANHFLYRVERCSYDISCPFYTHIQAVMQHHVWLHELRSSEQRALQRRLASKAQRAESARKFILKYTKTEENVHDETNLSQPSMSTATQKQHPENSYEVGREGTKVTTKPCTSEEPEVFGQFT